MSIRFGALVLALLGPARGLAADAGTGAPATLKVATWNILAGERGLDGVAAVLKSLDADLIGLQEVDQRVRRSGRADQPAVLAQALGYHRAFAAHFPFQGGEYGVALLSRFPLADVEVHRPPGSRLAFLSATARAPLGPVKVVVVHFTVTLPSRSAEKQAAQDAARLAEASYLAQLVGGWSLPTLVLGDFNTTLGSEAYQLVSHALRDACAGTPEARTWSSAAPVKRIDYVWFSAALDAEDCSTRATEASDHLPVVSRLRLSPISTGTGGR